MGAVDISASDKTPELAVGPEGLPLFFSSLSADGLIDWTGLEELLGSQIER